MALYKIGDKVKMRQEVLNDLDLGDWAWHESLKGKILTIALVDESQPAGWCDYYVVESPFLLAEKWLELVESAKEDQNEQV